MSCAVILAWPMPQFDCVCCSIDRNSLIFPVIRFRLLIDLVCLLETIQISSFRSFHSIGSSSVCSSHPPVSILSAHVILIQNRLHHSNGLQVERFYTAQYYPQIWASCEWNRLKIRIRNKPISCGANWTLLRSQELTEVLSIYFLVKTKHCYIYATRFTLFPFNLNFPQWLS